MARLNSGNPKHAEILELQKINQHRINQLAQMGVQVTVNRELAMLEEILGYVAPEGADVAFERKFQENLAGDLDNAEVQVRQAQLTQGVALGPNGQPLPPDGAARRPSG